MKNQFKDLIDRDLHYWERVADNYDKLLINPFTAEEGSVNYQEFEQKYIDEVIGEAATKNKIVLIELGCGTGRIFANYIDDDRIKYLIGIDFSEKMLKSLLKNFESCRETAKEKLILAQCLAEESFISFDDNDEFRDTIPIVICMFNTLGNVEQYERRIEVLKRIKEMIGDRGIGIISVFNRDLMKRDATGSAECQRYYTDERVQKLIVPPNIVEKCKIAGASLLEQKQLFIYQDSGDVRTKDFYSHWFDEAELRNIIKISGLSVIEMNVGNEMGRENFRAKRGLIAKVGPN
jgi:SAM-dependent methyltransferase